MFLNYWKSKEGAYKVEFVQKTFGSYIETIKTFIQYSQGFFKRHTPGKGLSESIVNALKDMLTIRKKVKIAQYRVNYHKNQLRKMESLIANDNEHTFLRGTKLNQVR